MWYFCAWDESRGSRRWATWGTGGMLLLNFFLWISRHICQFEFERENTQLLWIWVLNNIYFCAKVFTIVDDSFNRQAYAENNVVFQFQRLKLVTTFLKLEITTAFRLDNVALFRKIFFIIIIMEKVARISIKRNRFEIRKKSVCFGICAL